MSPIDVDRDALVRLFLEESREGLAAMEEALVALEAGPDGSDALKTLFRMAHTLKGNAASLGFTEIAETTHEMENVLDCLRSGSLAVSEPVTDLLLESVDALREMLVEAKA
jgi:two-component system chemotaxis sensor kinase CheA